MHLASSEELHHLSDTLVITLASKGELSAMEELIRRQQGKVRQFMYHLCHHRDEADDLAQQAFLKIWQALPQLRTTEAYFGWQKKLMVNVWKESLRKQKIQFSDGDKSAVAEPLSSSDNQGLKRDLQWALAQLSPESRLCIVCAYYIGLSHREIAELSDLALGTVKSHINRGSHNLRELLGDWREDKDND